MNTYMTPLTTMLYVLGGSMLSDVMYMYVTAKIKTYAAILRDHSEIITAWDGGF